MSLDQIPPIATSVGVILVFVQLFLNRRQQRTAFEDDLAREYREIARKLPAASFMDKRDKKIPLGHPLKEHLGDFLQYVDLSNEQVFLRMQRRVGYRTWRNWAKGIRVNLGRPGFSEAWSYIKEHSHQSYEELVALEASHWEDDPGWWDPPSPWQRLYKFVRRFPDQPAVEDRSES